MTPLNNWPFQINRKVLEKGNSQSGKWQTQRDTDYSLIGAHSLIQGHVCSSI